MIGILFFCLVFCFLLFVTLFTFAYRAKITQEREARKVPIVGFFHPYCNAGGGGERVLWCAIKALQEKYPNVEVVVYTGDTSVTKKQFLENAKNHFDIQLFNVDFVYLSLRSFVEAKNYPAFTLLGQSIGSLVLGFEALYKKTPDVYIDTMGYAFTLPIFKLLAGCETVSYVHYPTISVDMLSNVYSQRQTFNNTGTITKSAVLTQLKGLYYKVFAQTYGLFGSCSDVVMVNSSWTNGHISQLWSCTPDIVYPPCNTSTFEKLDCKKEPGSIVSVAQFRPEKDHMLQLHSLKEYFKLCPSKKETTKLTLVGGCRNADDENRVAQLQATVKELDIEKQVVFLLNAPFDVLCQELGKAEVGLHTMWNEHFGIGIVEYMASGAIPLAHDSGGPKADIIPDDYKETIGFRASSSEEYANKISYIFDLTNEERQKIRVAGRKSVTRFSDEVFAEKFISSLSGLSQLKK